jgi:hypothetical protein
MTDIKELYNTITSNYNPIFKRLPKNFPIDKNQNAAITSNKLIEQMVKLHIRFEEITECTTALSNIMFENTNEKIVISDIKFNKREELYQMEQLKLVDKIEGFHQQIYSTISSFGAVLTSYFPHEWRKNMNISSNTKFLDFLKTKSDDIDFNISLNQLQLSTAYRAKFVDHAQQHRILNWLTQTIDSLPYIVHFKPQLFQMICPFEVPNKETRYESYYENNDFYVSPNNFEVYKSLIIVINFCLYEIADEL